MALDRKLFRLFYVDANSFSGYVQQPAKRLRNECGGHFYRQCKKSADVQHWIRNVSSLTSYSVMYSSFTTLLLIMLSAVIAAMEGYSYLYDRRKVDRFHSEPVSCRIRFFSIYLNGFKNFALPYLCSVLLSVLIGGYYHLLTGK